MSQPALKREDYKWCPICGKSIYLQEHHVIFRSQGGHDGPKVYICFECHERRHREEILIEIEDGQIKVTDKTTGEVYYRSLKPHEPTAEEGALAYRLHGAIMDLKASIELRFWQLGQALKEMRDSELYKVLGAETFNEYLGFPELSLQRSQAYKFISICEQAERLQLAPERLALIDKDKLATALPKATPETIEDVLADCETLSRSDLQEQYKSPGSVERPSCWTEHEYVCSNCGTTNRVKIKK